MKNPVRLQPHPSPLTSSIPSSWSSVLEFPPCEHPPGIILITPSQSPTRFHKVDPALGPHTKLAVPQPKMEHAPYPEIGRRSAQCQTNFSPPFHSLPPLKKLTHLRTNLCDRHIQPFKEASQVGWAVQSVHQIAADTRNADFSFSI